MSGTPSPKESSSSGSAASFIKGVEQLIQSDEDQLNMAKMNSLHSTFPVLNKIHNQMTNSEKLVIFMRDHLFRHRLCQKLFQQFGSQKIPTIKVQVYSIRYRSVIQQELDQSDLVKTLQKFGKISIISVDKIYAYAKFESLLSSYLAIQILNEFQIVCDLLRLSVRWCKPEQQLLAEQFFSAKFNSITKAFGNHQASQKFNAKYQIHLACPPEFKLPQKIIGPKGNNMKKIFESISQQQKIASIKQLQKNLKLRLRGKGSGYSQGPDGQESDEILNLCVSAKQKKLYDSACMQIERILQKLANDYKFEFERTYRRLLEGTIYKKYELQVENYKLTNELKLQQLPNNLNEIDENRARKLTVQEIEQYINLRNKARKNGHYQQADQIRDRLKKKGILLVDGTGKKNCYTTTWSYIGE